MRKSKSPNDGINECSVIASLSLSLFLVLSTEVLSGMLLETGEIQELQGMKRGNFPLWTSERLCKQTLAFRLAGPGPYLAFSSQRRRRGRNRLTVLIIFPALQILGSRK